MSRQDVSRALSALTIMACSVAFMPSGADAKGIFSGQQPSEEEKALFLKDAPTDEQLAHLAELDVKRGIVRHSASAFTTLGFCWGDEVCKSKWVEVYEADAVHQRAKEDIKKQMQHALRHYDIWSSVAVDDAYSKFWSRVVESIEYAFWDEVTGHSSRYRRNSYSSSNSSSRRSSSSSDSFADWLWELFLNYMVWYFISTVAFVVDIVQIVLRYKGTALSKTLFLVVQIGTAFPFGTVSVALVITGLLFCVTAPCSLVADSLKASSKKQRSTASPPTGMADRFSSSKEH